MRALALSHVTKEYAGRSVLSACSLVVPEGLHTAILGRSGQGKSTVLRLLAGLELPTRGEVLVDDAVASDRQRCRLLPHRRGIAMVFQDLGLWPALSVVENVVLGLAGTLAHGAEATAKASAALRLCGIEALAARAPGSLSGGEQQRVALARALAVAPQYLFLDEPFSELDLCTRRELVEDIAALAAVRRITLVLVTHDALEALALCRRAVVLDGGGVVADGAWDDVLRDPRLELLRLIAERRPMARHGHRPPASK